MVHLPPKPGGVGRTWDHQLLLLFLLLRLGHAMRVCASPGSRGPKDHMNSRILRTIVSGISLVLGPRTGRQDPYVYVVFGAAEQCPPCLTVHAPKGKRIPRKPAQSFYGWSRLIILYHVMTYSIVFCRILSYSIMLLYARYHIIVKLTRPKPRLTTWAPAGEYSALAGE